MQLREEDHDAIDAFLDAALHAYQNGQLSELQTRVAIAHVLTVAAIGDEAVFKQEIRMSPARQRLPETPGRSDQSRAHRRSDRDW